MGSSGSHLQDTVRDLAVVFELEPPPGTDCPLSGLSGDVDEVRQQLVDDERHADMTVRRTECSCSQDDDCLEVRHATSEVEETCPCTVFSQFGCVPEIAGVNDGCIRIETYLSDRDRLPDLVAALREVVDGFRLHKLTRTVSWTAERSQQLVTLDLYELTEKQRAAITKAVATGYYGSPQETSLGELADDLDLSKSALSQRLTAAESKLATGAFERAAADD